ncbi:c-type cytochrome [Sphingomonas panacisoli]|uniref:c-type cytochrome n=1 Tax=Sphingomonas panacisoli TaxID=1813879 RepID=UPI0016451AB0|nr:c-type cytochrome [Sphingomonas panacisoli]
MIDRYHQYVLGAGTTRLLTTAIVSASLTACHGEPRTATRDAAARGAVLITQQACGSCHVIPGIEEADGKVGPPLSGFARQRMIAGAIPNTPANLILFLRSPDAVVKGSVMPGQHLSDAQLRDVAAYLGTLQ